jgi:hypothetical protein
MISLRIVFVLFPLLVRLSNPAIVAAGGGRSVSVRYGGGRAEVRDCEGQNHDKFAHCSCPFFPLLVGLSNPAIVAAGGGRSISRRYGGCSSEVRDREGQNHDKFAHSFFCPFSLLTCYN